MTEKKLDAGLAVLRGTIIALTALATMTTILAGCSDYASEPDPVVLDVPTVVNPEYDANDDGTDETGYETGSDENGYEEYAGDIDVNDSFSDSDAAVSFDEFSSGDGSESDSTELGCPGEFGCSCDEPSDCYSGFCTPWPDGGRCTKMCSSEELCGDEMTCSAYSGTGADAVYVCLHRWPTACRPCIADADCSVAWMDADSQPACMNSSDGSSFCAPACSDASDCPDGYLCVRDGGRVSNGGHCMPESGSCPCTDFWLRSGFETTCSRSNEFGTCSASRLCNEECPAPEPALEQCDGVDNDCDGQTDEDQNDRFCEIMNEWGICPGKTACANGSQICLGDGAEKESCNGMDDDCDGFTDEDLGETLCGTGACRKVVPNCISGRPVFCIATEGSSPEKCDGIDNDCDGRTDEDMGLLECGVGACARSVPACLSGRPNVCVPALPGLTDACDGIDNDCDGKTDEHSGNITCGQGVCQHTVPACANGRANKCNPFQGMQTETCDGLDNDCDGSADNNLFSVKDDSEPNANCGYPEEMGTIEEGAASIFFRGAIYPEGDQDWFRFKAHEKDHSCVLGTDQDYKITFYLLNPVGPKSCHDFTAELYDDSCRLLASATGLKCTNKQIEFRWDGECGPDDTRYFRLRIKAVDPEDFSCIQYFSSASMTKL